MLFSDAGKAVRFAESEVRAMGRTAGGVRGMRLAGASQVISLIAAADETLSVLDCHTSAATASARRLQSTRAMGAGRRA